MKVLVNGCALWDRMLRKIFLYEKSYLGCDVKEGKESAKSRSERECSR